MCDDGSESISKEFKVLLKQFNVEISYAAVNDHILLQRLPSNKAQGVTTPLY